MEYYIWLQMAFPFGNKKSDFILENYDIKEFYLKIKSEKLTSFDFLTTNDIEKLQKIDIAQAIDIKEKTEKLGYKIIPYKNKYYPKAFYSIDEMPVVIYADGDYSALMALNTELCITVIGSRKVSEYALYSAADTSYHLSKCGAIVVSGFALGADSAAHKGALLADGETVAVLGCGLDIDYPFQNTLLGKAITRKGVRLTEYIIGTKAFGYNFPKRNRLLSALSKGIVVTEAGEKSGALITVNYATEQGKDVFVIPNNIYNSKAKGTINLLKDGAIIVSSVKDILDEYKYLPEFENIDTIYMNENKPLSINYLKEKIFKNEMIVQKPTQSTKQTKTSTPVQPKKMNEQEKPVKNIKTKKKNNIDDCILSETAKEIYNALNIQPLGLQGLIEKLSVPLNEILTGITELELNDIINLTECKKYEIN